MYMNFLVHNTYFHYNCVIMCNSSDERTPLVQEAESTSKNSRADNAIVSMLEHYRRSELYTVTEKQIKYIFDDHQEKESSGNEEMTEAPNYATNIFWQVNISCIICICFFGNLN